MLGITVRLIIDKSTRSPQKNNPDNLEVQMKQVKTHVCSGSHVFPWWETNSVGSVGHIDRSGVRKYILNTFLLPRSLYVSQKRQSNLLNTQTCIRHLNFHLCPETQLCSVHLQVHVYKDDSIGCQMSRSPEDSGYLTYLFEFWFKNKTKHKNYTL